MTDPARFRVNVGRSAGKVLRRLPKNLARRLASAIDALAEDPRPRGCKRLQGQRDLYRVRVGDWRITYAIYEDQLVVVIVEVAPRGGAYRNLR